MKIELKKVYAEFPDLSNQEYHDLNHFPDNNTNNSLNDFSDEMTIFEILKLIENPEEHINSELPFILENLINSKKIDETNTNAILIADLSRVIIQHLKWSKCFPHIKPFYKIEANNNLELLRVIKKLGINFICNNQSDLNEIFNIDMAENQIININSNNFDSMIKLNNSFRLHGSSSKISNSKGNFYTLQCNNESTTNDVYPAKIIFTTKPLSDKEFSYDKIVKNTFPNEMIKSYDKIGSFICNDLEEIKDILEKLPSASLILRVNVNDTSEITRAERNRLFKIFEISEELNFNNNINGLSLELSNDKNNEVGKYIKTDKIYDVMKRVREIFDLAEEYGIEIKIFDVGNPENEEFLTEENIKLLNESLDYFFSDLKIEFIAQLGKFFCGPAFSLMQKNSKKAFNLNINENINNISSDNNVTITNSHSSSSSNLVSLNSTELSVNGNISAINQNSTYYLDIDFLPLEENNNLGLNNTEDSPNNMMNKNFTDDFILNNSSIFDSPTSNSKEHVINLNNDLIVDDNLNKFICIPTSKNFNDEFEFNKIKLEETAFDYDQKVLSDKQKKASLIKKTKNKSSIISKISNEEIRKRYKKGTKFEDDLKEETRKIDCKTKNCIQWKMENFNNDLNKNILEDWFIFENVGNDGICKDCKTNGYCKPEIYYINNRISIKLEKYFYVIMNKFDS